MKDAAPRRPDNKALDLVRAVSKSFLEFCMAGERSHSSRNLSPVGEWGGVRRSRAQSSKLPRLILIFVSCTVGSSYLIGLVVWKNHSVCHVCSQMHMCTRVGFAYTPS